MSECDVVCMYMGVDIVLGVLGGAGPFHGATAES